MSNTAGFLNQFQQVICLSLPSTKDRRKHIQQLVDKYQLRKFRFFDATSATDEIVGKYYREGLVKRYPKCFRCDSYECGNENCNNTLIPAQVATFISYLRLWNFIANGHYDSALIIEDDIELSPRAETVCGEFTAGQWLEKSGLLNDSPMLLRFGWALSQDHRIDAPFSFVSTIKMSNPCHAINRAMAKHLLSKFSTINTTADVFQHRNCVDELNAKTGFPPIFSEKSWSTGEFDSLIHPKQIRLDYLKHKGLADSAAYVNAREKLESHQAHTNYRRVLSIGHPRCGSAYTAQLLHSMGLDVGHEKMGNDGISSWMFAVYDEQNPWATGKLAQSRKYTWFKYVVQYVRDAKTAIPSIMRENMYAPKSFEFRRAHINQQFDVDITCYSTDLETAVASLVFWNKIVNLQSPDVVYRIEDGESDLLSFLGDAEMQNVLLKDIDLPEKNCNKDKAYNGVVHAKPEITNQDISQISPELLDLLREYCHQYGYAEWRS